MQAARFIFQLFFLEFILYNSIYFFTGASYRNCESFCPMGAVEVLPLFLKNLKYPCAVNELNLAILLGVVALTVVFKRAFCSWVCPLGALNEFAFAVREKFAPYAQFSKKIAERLASVKYAGLIALVAATTWYYDLVFRPYCPFFTAFGLHGHTTRVISYFVLANVAVLALSVRMGWCRIACPFGAFLNLFNSATVFALTRDPAACSGCGLCDRACPSDIEVSRCERITSRECTMCARCVSACPKSGVINLESK